MQKQTSCGCLSRLPVGTFSTTPTTSEANPNSARNSGVLVVLEGLNDIQFLLRISRILHVGDDSIPDLSQLEEAGRLVFVPFGGGNLTHWSHRLAAIGWCEFHVYDQELPPETELRRQAARAVNKRPGCQAAVMRKRSLENYLDPLAIEEDCGIKVTFSDTDSVADVVARAGLPPGCQWDELSRRAQKRLKYRVKKRLNTTAVDRMTPERLSQRDPAGEVVSWLATIARFANLHT